LTLRTQPASEENNKNPGSKLCRLWQLPHGISQEETATFGGRSRGKFKLRLNRTRAARHALRSVIAVPATTGGIGLKGLLNEHEQDR
jgi:hypothetical protein